jgi:hypothetical protein
MLTGSARRSARARAAVASAATAAATCRPSGARSSAACATARSSASSRRTRSSSASTSGARRLDPRRLPGLRRGDVAADRPRRPAGETSVASSSRRGAGRPVRDPPPRVPPRGRARGGAARPGQPPRPPRPSSCGDVRAAVRARRGVRAGPGRRPARVPRRGGPRPPGRRRPWYWSENFPASEISLRTAAPENVVIIDTTPGPAARPRRGRPVQRPGPRPRARDLHARVGPVPRRQARVGRAQGVRPQDRRRPLHVREPRGDAQAARRVRRGAGTRAAGGSTAR